MTVEELIEKLQKMDKDSEVILYSEEQDVYYPSEGVKESDQDVIIY